MSTAKLTGFGAVVLLAFSMSGCSGSGADSDDGNLESTSEALSSTCNVGLGGPSLLAYSPNYWTAKQSSSTIVNGGYVNDLFQTKVCMQQLVSGGWQTMDFTCVTGYVDIYGDHINTNPISYYTNGRWYRTWAWGYNHNPYTNQTYTNTCVTNGCQGNGGSGCN
jgi:hypothetical protein